MSQATLEHGHFSLEASQTSARGLFEKILTGAPKLSEALNVAGLRRLGRELITATVVLGATLTPHAAHGADRVSPVATAVGTFAAEIAAKPFAALGETIGNHFFGSIPSGPVQPLPDSALSGAPAGNPGQTLPWKDRLTSN